MIITVKARSGKGFVAERASLLQALRDTAAPNVALDFGRTVTIGRTVLADVLRLVDAPEIKMVPLGSNGRTSVRLTWPRHEAIIADGAWVKYGQDTERLRPRARKAQAQGVELEGRALADALALVMPCVSRDSGGRPVLEHMLLEADGESLTLVGADSFWLGVAHVAAPGLEGHWLLGRTAAKTLAAQARKGPVMLEPRGDTLWANGQQIAEPTGLTFPNYRILIPAWEQCKAKATIWADGLKRIKGLTVGKDGADIVRLTQGDNALVLTARDEDGDTQAITLEAALEGDPGARVALHRRYLGDVAQTFKGMVKLGIGSPSNPVLLEEERGLWVVMPMFVNW